MPHITRTKSLLYIFIVFLTCFRWSFFDYHPRMRVGYVFGHFCVSVCLSVCVSVCVSVFLSVQAITFEPLDTETSFFVCRYILTISRASLNIKVTGVRSRSYEKKYDFTYFNLLILCMWLQVINKVKIIH